MASGSTVLFAATDPDEVFGCLRTDGPIRTVDEMNAGSIEEARRRHADASKVVTPGG